MKHINHIAKSGYILSSILLFSLFFWSKLNFAQDFVSGSIYLDENEYVKYLPGNLPIVISVPHGGDLLPDSIPDRDCDGCVYIKDCYTQELAREVRAVFL